MNTSQKQPNITEYPYESGQQIITIDIYCYEKKELQRQTPSLFHSRFTLKVAQRLALSI